VQRALSIAIFASLLFAGDVLAQDLGSTLIVNVVTRSNQGKVFCALWRGREGYPTERRHAVAQAIDRSIVRNRAQCLFEAVSPGDGYAVAAFHDENANNDLDRGIFGIPTEGTGASNDARGFMGPPPYDGARFRVPDAPEHRITIHIGY
jgi:uncharacterized protein (DUF2141 family)